MPFTLTFKWNENAVILFCPKSFVTGFRCSNFVVKFYVCATVLKVLLSFFIAWRAQANSSEYFKFVFQVDNPFACDSPINHKTDKQMIKDVFNGRYHVGIH